MRVFLAILTLTVLAACAGAPPTPLSPEKAQAVAFRADEPPQITVITMINNKSGAGGHTGLLISASQRVLFDPAGNFRHSQMFRHDDVIYGVTDQKLQVYRSAHARATHHVVSQTLRVSPESAEKALRLAQARGRVPSAFCTNSSTELLRQIPEFADVQVTFYPDKLMDQIARKPGVVTERYFEDDEGNLAAGAAGLEGALPQ